MWPCTQFYTPKGLILSDIWARRFRPATARYPAHFSQKNNNKGKAQSLEKDSPHCVLVSPWTMAVMPAIICKGLLVSSGISANAELSSVALVLSFLTGVSAIVSKADLLSTFSESWSDANDAIYRKIRLRHNYFMIKYLCPQFLAIIENDTYGPEAWHMWPRLWDGTVFN